MFSTQRTVFIAIVLATLLTMLSCISIDADGIEQLPATVIDADNMTETAFENPAAPPEPTIKDEQNLPAADEAVSTTETPISLSDPSGIFTTQDKQCLPKNEKDQYGIVTHVVDGDTIYVEIDNQEYKLR